MNKREVGTNYEGVAARHLIDGGLEIIERNYRCRYGEIDLIAKDKDTLVFVEVKYRRNNTLERPEYAINYGKQKKICRAADMYRVTNEILPSAPVRYDVVAVEGDEIRWHKNAFYHIGWA